MSAQSYESHRMGLMGYIDDRPSFMSYGDEIHANEYEHMRMITLKERSKSMAQTAIPVLTAPWDKPVLSLTDNTAYTYNPYLSQADKLYEVSPSSIASYLKELNKRFALTHGQKLFFMYSAKITDYFYANTGRTYRKADDDVYEMICEIVYSSYRNGSDGIRDGLGETSGDRPGLMHNLRRYFSNIKATLPCKMNFGMTTPYFGCGGDSLYDAIKSNIFLIDNRKHVPFDKDMYVEIDAAENFDLTHRVDNKMTSFIRSPYTFMFAVDFNALRFILKCFAILCENKHFEKKVVTLEQWSPAKVDADFKEFLDPIIKLPQIQKNIVASPVNTTAEALSSLAVLKAAKTKAAPKPTATIVAKSDKMTTLSTQVDQIKDANLQAFALAGKIEAGKAVIALIKTQLADKVPEGLTIWTQHPAFDLIVANLANIAIQQFAADHPKAQFVNEALMIASAQTLVQAFNIPGFIRDVLDSTKI